VPTSDFTMPSPKAIAIVNEKPIDLLVTHIEIRDRIAIRCDLDTQTPQEQYIKDKKRAVSPHDTITTYIFGRSVHANEGSYCVEVPYSPTCYMRVPDFWESMTARIPNILSHLLTCLIGNAEYAKPYAKCLSGKFVRMLHAFGYRPEPHYLYLKIDCSNRHICNKLRSLLSSYNTFRRTSYQSKQFYARFLTMGFLSANKIRKQGEVEDLIRNTNNHWYTKEWFVCHEFLDDKIAFLKSLEMEINGFVRVSKGTLRRKPSRGFSNAANEIVCKSATDVHGIGLDVIPKGTLAGIVKMSFDIECASHDIVNHPHHDRAYDKVSQIGTKTGSILDPQHAQRIVFTLGKPSPSEKCTYRTYAHETGLLVGFAKFIVQHDVDIFNTFNGLDFDWDYLHKRACLAMFCQSSSSFVVALARWEHMHEQYQAYMPLQKEYTKLSTKYKKREDQEKPIFKKKQHLLFTKMATILELPVSKRFFRQPMQDPYKQAIWSVSSEAELRKFFHYFNAQPSIVPWFYMHRMRCTKMGFDIRPKSSAAMGNQLLKSPNDGRTNSDMFLYIKTSYAMDSYGLNACADKFLKNQSKDDLLDHYKQHKDELDIQLRSASSTNNAYRMMYEYVASNRPELIKAVCEYCDQDVEVTDLLDAKLGTSMELVSMMKRYRVILQALTRRAQQYRFMTNVSFEILNKFVFNSYDRTAKAPTYQGAAVLPPTWGLHGAPWEWVFCLDFASLYPTIMRERSFCIRSFILPCDRPRILALVRAGKHPPIMAVPYSREYVKGRDPIIWINKDTPDFDMNSTALFAIMKTQDTILPKFLERMGNDRNAVKKEMKVVKKEMEKHPEQKDALAFKHMVLDSEQKAIKIGMNSVYGSLGVKEGTITGLQEIAMSVTYCGRMYIFKTRDFCYDYAATTPGWEDLDLEIVYGDTDSVFPKIRHKHKKPFDIKELWKKVEVMADTATRTLYNPPHNLELEYGTCKIAWFYEIDKKTKQKKGVKKRYISWKFMKPDMSCGKLSANGVEIKRRGSVQFVRTVYQAIVDSIWKHAVKDGKVVAEDTETTQRRAIEVYKKHLVDMENKEVPLEEFVYSRGLTSHPNKYKNQATPHVQCALQEIKAFDEGRLTTCPQAGDRVKFVPILRTNMKKRKASECVVSAKLFDPKTDTLDRKKVIDDLVNPLSQVMQSVMLDPAPMAIASARKCRAYDSRQSMIRDSGASDVKFKKCVIVSPPKKKVKANKDIRSFFIPN
jgi:DNA polymerase elongation subunit (family B)